MAAFFPILQEILPMLMPGSVHITKAEELQGPPRDAVHVEEEEEEQAGDDGEEAFDGEDEDDGDGNEKADTRHRPRSLGESGAKRDTGDTGEAGQRKDGDQENGNPAPPTAAAATQPGPSTRRRARKVVGRRPPNGVSLRDAIVHKSSSLCASVLTVKPQCATVVFHNGEQEAIVYAVSGTAVLATLPDNFDEDDNDNDHEGGSATSARKPPHTTTISAGDFAFIPAWTEHQVRNEAPATSKGGTDDGPATPSADVVWVVVRNAGEPTVVPLKGWGGEQAE
ncbi:uncharacterized protein SPSK_09692 [Sporothrix schenckii 1099-18]|uniref:Uncharacterized protein n=2 Tax=Sporothrix schenckii TaxID=29908 RepID=U7PY62_SPOS1|nr:uncharacterized protein SPSK_09692 [Sporothrix schenckii 1099-18]ERT00533.1 hypothetical protein HMPREF1624_03906 [Sporothrix schenckii ATCC 58251]KJR84961.1 hypothetical protein SPSK_09692 [Sporothrix schenckii 1099-18]